MKISICAVTHNSIKYLPDFMESIFEQSYFSKNNITPDIFIVDNASTDNTVKFIKDNYPTVHLLRNINNIGTSRAWNQAIKTTSGEYILIINPDVILHKDFISEALKVIQSDETIASLSGKLYQLRISTINEDELATFEKTNILDSCGLRAFKNRRFIDRGAGEVDSGRFNQREEIFGASAACVIYRRYALEQIKFNQEYFDEDFFIYKEDVDIAWRLRLAGWASVYTPSAIAYHHRRAKSQHKIGSLNLIKFRQSKETFINYYSYRNHLLMLGKNSLAINFFKHFPYIFVYELKKFLYVLILENSTLRKTILDLVKLRKKMRQKRHFNLQLKRVKADEMQEWFK
jgi:GT2 family glycosyltransferase